MRVITFLFIFFTSICFSQTNYVELDTTSQKPKKELKNKLKKVFKYYSETISKNYRGKVKKAIIEEVKSREKYTLKMLANDEFLFNNDFTIFLEQKLDTINYYNNNIINQDLIVLLSRSPSPNAISLGNGIIIINMGLFKYLNNEHQVSGVVLHEIAHDLENHALNNIIKEAENTFSDKNKNQIKKLNNEQYNKGGLAFRQLKNLLIDKSVKSQLQENIADSLGYNLYKKTNWPKVSFVNALKVLREIEDAPYYELDSTTYIKYFDLKDQPFKKSWLEQEDFSAYNYNHYKEKIDKDSISSHPETIERIERLTSLLNEGETDESIIKSEVFSALQKQAVYQQIANLYALKEYGSSLYSTLILLETYPESDYLLRYIGLNFQQIYTAQKEYKLNRYLEQLNPNEQSDSYFTYLNFIWNLKLDEMKFIADYYTVD